MQKYGTTGAGAALRASVAAVSLAVAGAAHAGENGWSAELAAGFLATGGNSESRTSNFRASTEFATRWFNHALSGVAIQTRDTGETTAERYTTDYKLDFNFTGEDFLFFAAGFEKDLFGGVRRKTTQTAGYGRRFIQTERQEWSAELGAGARQLRFQPPQDESESELIGRFFTKYLLKFGDDNSIRQSIRVEAGDSNTQTESISEVRLSVIGNLFASLSYTIRNNSDVSDDLKKTDTYTAINLNYTFGTQ